MKTQFSLAAILSVGLALLPAANAYDPNDKLLVEALKLYNKGQVDRAIPLILQDLKDNPNNGTAHYYLGMALKQGGADANAISELEMAAKLLPAGVTQDLAKKALHGGFLEDLSERSNPAAAAVAPVKTPPPPPQNWFSSIYDFFQPPKPVASVPKVTIAAPSFPILPDLGDAMQGTKHWIRDQSKSIKKLIKNPGSQSPPPGSPSGNGNSADIIPMGEMLNLADDSRGLNRKSQSHPSGVVTFEQAPESSLEWEMWIKRFRRTFDSQVFRHIFKEAKDERTGSASVIFSVDRQGNLRGCVYTATADEAMQNCLLQATRELNKSYVLAFPAGSRINGWNFRMTWNFGKALTFVRAVREARAKEAAKTQIDVTALIKQKQAESAAQAKAKLLADKKKAIAKTKVAVHMPPPRVVKMGVNAQLIKPVELKAVPLKLSDMPALPKNAPRLTTDDVDDFVILNKDVSGLFH